MEQTKKLTVYQCPKGFIKNDEAKAKRKAAKKLGVPTKLLKTDHTNLVFRFKKR